MLLLSWIGATRFAWGSRCQAGAQAQRTEQAQGLSRLGISYHTLQAYPLRESNGTIHHAGRNRQTGRR